MSRFVDHREMSEAELMETSYQAAALIRLCQSAACQIENGDADTPHLSGAIGSGLALAIDLMAPLHDALETHEGAKRKASGA